LAARVRKEAIGVHSYWQETAPRLGFPPLEGDRRVDVAVVGGGLAGVSAALAAREAGASVALLEAGQIAAGASGRNGGFLLRGAAVDYAELAEKKGRHVARAMMALSLENRRLILELAAEEAVDVELRLCGSLTLAADAEELELLRRSAELLREDGHRSEEVDLAGLPEGLRTRYIGGYFTPDDGELHPAKWLRAMAARLARRGGEVYEGTPVAALEGTTAVTARGRVVAERVVLALNAYVGRLLPELEHLARPVRGQVLVTAPGPRRWYVPMYARWGYEYYRQLADGRFLVGGWRDVALAEEQGWDLVLNERVHRALDAFLAETVPGARVERRWAGIMGFSPDMLPSVGEVRPGVVVVGGFSGHGVALAPRLGRMAAELALGLGGAPAFLDPGRHTLATTPTA
jgi:gamma-glutamylputrescine oxidase